MDTLRLDCRRLGGSAHSVCSQGLRPASTVLAQARERLSWPGPDLGVNRLHRSGPNREPSRLGSATLSSMTIKARVTAGRLVVDEPTDLPEGTELELLPLDPGDWLDDADRAALQEALRQSEEDVAADRLVDASEILKELRSR